MAWESDNEQDDAGRDWSKAMWYGLAALIAIMIVLLFIPKDLPTLQTRARVWHILVNYDPSVPGQREAAHETASSLRGRIIDGESFSKIAKEYSSDERSAVPGGDLGWVVRGSLADVVEAVVWELPLNQISEVVETIYGFHLVLVSEREITDADIYERELHERILEKSTGGAGR